MDAGEREALISLFKATGGDSWYSKDGWCTNAPLGKWSGVVTNDQGSVVKLKLIFNNLKGVIPAKIGELKNLQELELSNNHLNGVIPAELGKLTNLQKLHLAVNQLSGSIPKEIGLLINLEELELGINNLTGAIPTELGKLEDLQELVLRSNKLSGPIPKELGHLIKLKIIWLRDNKLTGDIPKELGELKDLQYLNLSENQLSGDIPKELGELKDLQYLNLSKNQLSDAIPKELGELKGLRELSLRNNQLSGDIPKELGELKDLQYLNLSENQLSGAIPKELGELKGLRDLYLHDNQLSAIGEVEEAQWLLSKFGEQHWGLSLNGNPWIMPPEAVVENGMASIKTYYTDVQMATEAGAKVTPRRLLKVVLVGSSSAGKTSLMESIISRRASRTEGTLEEASTEGIDVRPHQLENTSVGFYDCAGQVDYGGMHQVFMTRRALFLLVWDITRCSGRSDSDLDEVIRDMIMRWLYTLHLRAPGATVLLVANKCDSGVNDAAETTQRVEKRVRIMLQKWKDRRGYNQNSGEHRPKKNSTDINLLKGSSLTSCDNYVGIPALIERVLEKCVSSIKVPPSWELALEFINALRCKRSPVHAVFEYLQFPVTVKNVGADLSGSFITKEELSRMWRSVVEKAKDEMLRISTSGMSRLWQDFVGIVIDRVSRTGNEAALNNSDSALEGALRISEFAGQILFVQDGKGIFLDVVWLSDLLTPILSHKLKDKDFPTAGLCAMRDDLVEDKILRWEFARYLWRNVLPHHSLQSGERVAHALYSVLIKLGVVLPLDTTRYATNEGSALRRSQRIHESLINPPDMLVLMRLRETLLEEQQKFLDECTIDALRGASEVTLKWKFDSAGSPYGLVERIIASCHKIGVVERSLCWRYGALFRNGQNAQGFTMIIRYDTIRGTGVDGTAHFLMLRVIGRLENLRVWAALRYVASAVVMLSKEWPGVILRGSPVCPSHLSVSPIIYLAIPDEARIGGPLIPEAARGARRNQCDCQVIGRVVEELGLVVDIKKNPFEGLPDADVPSSCDDCKNPHPRRPSSFSDDHEIPNVRRRSLCNELREMFNVWRRFARETAGGLWTLTLVLFGGITAGVVESPTLWQVCLAVMLVTLVGAVASSVIFYQDIRLNANQHDVRQRAISPADGAYGDV